LAPPERQQYQQIVTYLANAGLRRLVKGGLAPHGQGGSLHVTFEFFSDDQSKTDLSAILLDTRIFSLGRFGSRHAKEVGAAVRADADDFRSRMGKLGPRSLELMINWKTSRAYADIDRFDMYGGLAPATAHVFLEFLPDKIRRTISPQRELIPASTGRDSDRSDPGLPDQWERAATCP
jgi:hypothetical protein